MGRSKKEVLENQVEKESDEVVFERAIENFVKSFAKEKEESVHEINVFVKFHKGKKGSELYTHMLKRGKLITSKSFVTKEIGKPVMTQIEKKFESLSKRHNVPVSLCTYDLKLPIDSAKVIITPHAGGKHLKEVTIKELM